MILGKRDVRKGGADSVEIGEREDLGDKIGVEGVGEEALSHVLTIAELRAILKER